MHANNNRPRLIVIVGPTAVGKTEVAIRLASEWGGEIISADSMQVYRFMDIGTAKPTTEEQSVLPHHLIDVVDPDEQFNAAMFVELARGIIGQLHSRRKPIFVVGGTGLYVKALLGGLFKGPDADEDLRKLYKEELKHFGKTYLYEKLRKKDERQPPRLIRMMLYGSSGHWKFWSCAASQLWKDKRPTALVTIFMTVRRWVLLWSVLH